MPSLLMVKEPATFALEVYRPPKNRRSIARTHVAFSGSPRKHPFDPSKVVLVADPYSSNTFYYEFKVADIAFVEELANLVNDDQEVIPMARVWVQKKRIGVRCTPFVIDDTIQ